MNNMSQKGYLGSVAQPKSDPLLYNEKTYQSVTTENGLIWSEREDQRLFNSYRKVKKEIMLILFPDRTWQGILSRASVLRIANRKYTEQEDTLLMNLKDQGLEYKKIALQFDKRTPDALKKRVERIRKMRALE